MSAIVIDSRPGVATGQAGLAGSPRSVRSSASRSDRRSAVRACSGAELSRGRVRAGAPLVAPDERGLLAVMVALGVLFVVALVVVVQGFWAVSGGATDAGQGHPVVAVAGDLDAHR